jgi:peptidoglycan hydrolase-like protein with peptidoglycan-binding domain
VTRNKAKWTASAVVAGGLLITGVAVGGSPTPATHPKTKTAASVTGPYADLDACSTMAEGRHGGCVEQLQLDLNNVEDAGLTLDGDFGASTEAAVVQFQQAHGISADGTVGPATRAALDTAAPGGTPGTSASTPDSTSSSGSAGGERLSDPGNGEMPATASGASSPAATPNTSSGSSNGEKICKGAGGAAYDLAAERIGALFPAVLSEPDIGAPYLDGNVVRADSSVSFDSWGSCGDQIAFQMQSKVCGRFGCNWVTRNHGTWAFLWAYDETGTVAQQVAMGCRPGTNSYRVEMNVINEQSTSEEGADDAPGAIGAENAGDPSYGPVVKLTC